MTIQVSPEIDGGRFRSAEKREAYLGRLLELSQANQPLVEGLGELRERAATLVKERAFPTTRDEEWRFTDLSSLLEITLGSISSIQIDSLDDYHLSDAANRLVFVNGQFFPALSAISELSPGVFVGNLTSVPDAIQERIFSRLGQQPGTEEVFTALNTAGLSDAAVVYVPKNQVVETPIHLLFVTIGEQPVIAQPRGLVVAEPNSAVTLIEEHITLGTSASLTNSVLEIYLDENAQVNHTRVQGQATTAYHVGKTAVSQARTSRYVNQSIDFGSLLSRHHLEIYQTGEQTETILNGLTFIRGEQVGDTHSAIALTQPHAHTRQLHKTIVDDRAHAIFNGKVFVSQKAQMTDAGQLNRNLLLSSKARVDTKPQLEIVADNVKCTHGATVGQLDSDEVFYLQSRGIDAASARNLLIYAFAYEILDTVPSESLKQRLLRQLALGSTAPKGIAR
ncbi:Fe-S cluster assembly protein SufD [Leptolyngbya sp. FACHB-16]|uniref:Fe-S cluster assembly protein SufD n=1 Tax=unclassified Leptolyngbya TaxID=2650499 RepID=UPI0016879EE1|nr:Fe-S cluster assembly protein SufD [Leptolyngbya sp. FACHB-16]MBD2158495.1 Fe-S cluster assembly protein SufD [Leptolyngbya sp. FACHB-16]